MSITGLVLAAGTSSRLGRPKQLLPYRDATLLDATLDVARRAPLDQVVVTLGGAAPEVRAAVNLVGIDVVENTTPTAGCSSSIRAALDTVDPRAEGIVLLLGDQPGVRVATISALVETARRSPLGAVCYDDGRGHPLWFGRMVFDDLLALQGDKAVWKLLASGRHPVVEVAVDGPVPGDVDTWEDYEALLDDDAARER